jgi:twitching motility protein PilU
MTDIHALMALMVGKGASDLFLTYNAPPHIKIEGVTHSVNAPAFKRGEVKQLAYSIMTDRQTAAFEETMESNLSLTVENVGRFRVNVFYQRGEVALVAPIDQVQYPHHRAVGHCRRNAPTWPCSNVDWCWSWELPALVRALHWRR